MLAHLDRRCIGVTLHPDLLAKWMLGRRAKQFPEPTDIFVHRAFRDCTYFQPTWRGSVSLFAVEIARKRYGYDRIALCGCPMTISGSHFERNRPWHDAARFRNGWTDAMQELKPYVRSFSGWTKEIFGEPSIEWLQRDGAEKCLT